MAEIQIKSDVDEEYDGNHFNNEQISCPFNGNSNNSNNDEDVRKFHILDETDDDGDDSDRSYTDDSDIPDDEIEKMLEEALENKRKRRASNANLGKHEFIIKVCFLLPWQQQFNYRY